VKLAPIIANDILSLVIIGAGDNWCQLHRSNDFEVKRVSNLLLKKLKFMTKQF
jgi:hypothetical protein